MNDIATALAKELRRSIKLNIVLNQRVSSLSKRVKKLEAERVNLRKLEELQRQVEQLTLRTGTIRQQSAASSAELVRFR